MALCVPGGQVRPLHRSQCHALKPPSCVGFAAPRHPPDCTPPSSNRPSPTECTMAPRCRRMKPSPFPTSAALRRRPVGLFGCLCNLLVRGHAQGGAHTHIHTRTQATAHACICRYNTRRGGAEREQPWKVSRCLGNRPSYLL